MEFCGLDLKTAIYSFFSPSKKSSMKIQITNLQIKFQKIKQSLNNCKNYFLENIIFGKTVIAVRELEDEITK